MVKTALAQDDEWWRQVFSEAEHRELCRVAEHVIAEFEYGEPEAHEVFFTIPLGELNAMIHAAYAWSRNEADTDDMQTMVALVWLLGEALTEVYYWDENIDPNETSSKAYRFWRGLDDDTPMGWEENTDDTDDE